MPAHQLAVGSLNAISRMHAFGELRRAHLGAPLLGDLGSNLELVSWSPESLLPIENEVGLLNSRLDPSPIWIYQSMFMWMASISDL